MTPTEILQSHLALCDELYQLALEENRFLKQHQRVPEATLLDRKRALLARLDTSLTELKAAGAMPPPLRPDPARKDAIEKARAKILQILHLDRENEQLLLRYSLGSRPKIPTSPVAPPPSQLQRIYERHS
jgi:type II secretory pathway component PulM